MLRGLWQLTWLEIKIFLREPLGVIGTVGDPGRCCSLVLGRLLGRGRDAGRPRSPRFAVASICRSSRRMLIADQRRAVARDDHLDLPRRRHPQAAARHAAAAAHHPDRARAGQAALHRDHARPADRWRAAASTRSTPTCRWSSFALALLFSTLSILSLGFVIASIVPDRALRAADRRARPLPDARRSRGCSCRSTRCRRCCRPWRGVLPLTYAVSLLQGIWHGEGWSATSATWRHWSLIFVVCTAYRPGCFAGSRARCAGAPSGRGAPRPELACSVRFPFSSPRARSPSPEPELQS